MLTRVRHGEMEGLAVYKPRRGETPLWDFPDGTLCLREYAAWVVDSGLGWGLVPPTVLRRGPAGFGAVQLFVHHDPDADVEESLDTHADALRRVAALDLVINNADRKAGHLVIDDDGKLWAVDHGIAFHAQLKLRTVIWAFAGEPIPSEIHASLEAFHDAGWARDELDSLLAPDEVEALGTRVERLLRSRRFPEPGPGRHVPWPPW